MNEHTTRPRSAHRHPRALFARMQIFAQNHPRAYAVRVVLIGFPVLVGPPLLLFVLTGDGRPYLPVLLGAAFPLVVVGALLILFMPRFLRRSLGTSTLAPDTDPVDLLEAKRQLRGGGLHERDEVNRVARVLAAQAEAKVNSPEAVNVAGLIAALLFAVLATLNFMAVGLSFGVWSQLVMALVFLSYPLFLGPWAKRYRQRARDFAGLYDNHRIASAAEPHLAASGS